MSDLSPRARLVRGVLIVSVLLAAPLGGFWCGKLDIFPHTALGAFNVWQSQVDSFVAREERCREDVGEALRAWTADPDMTTNCLKELRRARRRYEADQRWGLSDAGPEIHFGNWDQRLRGALEGLSAAAGHRAAAMGTLLWVVERGKSSYVTIFNSEWREAEADEAAALTCMSEIRKVLEAREGSGGT